VTFGKPAGPAGSGTVLPVQWESVEPGDGFTVLLDGDITLCARGCEHRPADPGAAPASPGAHRVGSRGLGAGLHGRKRNRRR